VAEAEAALSSLGGDALGDEMARAESVRARAEGLAALLAEKRRGAQARLATLADAGVVENLSAEAGRLREQMATVEAETEALAPEGESAAARRGAVQRAAAARSQMSALEAGLVREEAEKARLAERRQSAGRRRQRLEEEACRRRAEVCEETPLVEALEGARSGQVRPVAAKTASVAQPARQWTTTPPFLPSATDKLGVLSS
jgi:hypothetical protein